MGEGEGHVHGKESNNQIGQHDRHRPDGEFLNELVEVVADDGRASIHEPANDLGVNLRPTVALLVLDN